MLKRGIIEYRDIFVTVVSKGTIIGGENEDKIYRFLKSRPLGSKLHSFDLKPKLYIVFLFQKNKRSKQVGQLRVQSTHYPLFRMRF